MKGSPEGIACHSRVDQQANNTQVRPNVSLSQVLGPKANIQQLRYCVPILVELKHQVPRQEDWLLFDSSH